MREPVYVLAFHLRSLLPMTLKYDSLQAASSVLGFRDFSLVQSRFLQCKISDTWVLLKPSAFMILIEITSVRESLEELNI